MYKCPFIMCDLCYVMMQCVFHQNNSHDDSQLNLYGAPLS